MEPEDETSRECLRKMQCEYCDVRVFGQSLGNIQDHLNSYTHEQIVGEVSLCISFVSKDDNRFSGVLARENTLHYSDCSTLADLCQHPNVTRAFSCVNTLCFFRAEYLLH